MMTYTQYKRRNLKPTPEYKAMGYRLNFYYQESKKYPTEQYERLTESEAKDIINFLCEKFKFEVKEIKFTKSNRGKAWVKSKKIALPSGNPLLTVVHECAHICNYQKKINHFHNKHLMRTINIFMIALKKSKFASALVFTKP